MADPRPTLSPSRRAGLFALHGGLCHICKLKIDGVRERWEVEHVIPRAFLGRAGDTDDNMRPAHVHCHAIKTSADRTDIAKVERIRLKHEGAYRSRHPMNRGRKTKQPKRCAAELSRMGLSDA